MKLRGKFLTIVAFLFLFVTISINGSEAVVFDFGGVMTKEPNRQIVVDFLCQTCQIPYEEFKNINRRKKESCKSGVDDAVFWLNYAQEKAISLGDNWEQRFKDVMIKAVNINHEMYALVHELKSKHIPVALLSNIDTGLAQFIRSCDLYLPFHPCILSCDIGIEKPDLTIYQYLLDQLDLEANQVIFIDDKQENIDSAVKAGLDAILFVSADQIRNELKKRELL